MFRLSILVLLAIAFMATGCETGSTHVNVPSDGVQGQNVGQGSNKSGPVPGSTTGTNVTAQATPPADAAAQPAPAPQK